MNAELFSATILLILVIDPFGNVFGDSPGAEPFLVLADRRSFAGDLGR
jgi:hypothetical protein